MRISITAALALAGIFDAQPVSAEKPDPVQTVANAVTEISRQHNVTLVQLPAESQLVWIAVYAFLALCGTIAVLFLIARWLKPNGSVPETVVKEMVAAHERHVQQIIDEAERSIAAIVDQLVPLTEAVRHMAGPGWRPSLREEPQRSTATPVPPDTSSHL